METVIAGSTRIYMKGANFFVENYFQNMRMATYKKCWWIVKNQWFNAFVVMVRIAANVCYPYFYTFDSEFKVFFKNRSYFVVVDVSIDTT